MERITFQRSATGFNFTEANLRNACAELYSRSNEPKVAETVIADATSELLAEAHAISDRRGCDFFTAARLAVRSRPQLFRLTRCQSVSDGDHSADASVEQ